MSDQYENAVKKLMDYLDRTVIFAKGELPDVAQQMLVYGATMAQFWAMFWIVVSVASLVLWVLYMIVADEHHAAGKIFCGLFTLGFFIIAALNYGELVKIDKAPKLYIMQEVAAQVLNSSCGSK